MTKKSDKKKVMSTVADRPTVGQLLADTEEEHKKQQIEVGEFVEEVGNKEVMKEIWRQIDTRRDLPQWKKKWYLLVFFRKDTIMPRVIHCDIQSRHSEPKMEWGLTCFSYNPKGDSLLLEWVLPNKTALPMFLKNRYNTDPFLMHCIDENLKVNPVYLAI